MNKEQMQKLNFKEVKITFSNGEVLAFSEGENGQLRLPDGSLDHSLVYWRLIEG